MKRDEDKSPLLTPILDISGHFLTANRQRALDRAARADYLRVKALGDALETRIRISMEENERLARKMDAAHILDEIDRDDEAIRDYYYAPKVPSFEILKRSYDNQAFHFKDEKK